MHTATMPSSFVALTVLATSHSRDGDVTPLVEVVHLAHYGKAGNSGFVEQFGGSCLNCHVMDLETGAVKVKSRPSNW